MKLVFRIYTVTVASYWKNSPICSIHLSQIFQESFKDWKENPIPIPSAPEVVPNRGKQGKQHENYSVKCSFTLMTVVWDMQISA